jgi:DNA-binding response OmpR family regulator
MSDIKILVVHKNTKVADLIEKALNDAGFADIDTSSDAGNALDKMRAERYDLVMMDCIEYLAGLNFLKIVREDVDLKDIKCMMMFVDMDRNLFVGALEAGADAYIHMPYDPVRLKKAIDKIFSISL